MKTLKQIVIWDIIRDEYREQYDREEYLWVVFAIDWDFIKSAAIEEMKDWWSFVWLENTRHKSFFKEILWHVLDTKQFNLDSIKWNKKD